MPVITGTTKLTGLLGDPVQHSISPLIHNFSFQTLHLDYVYLCFQINEQTLEDAVKGLRVLDIKGFNLTMPNKTKILSCLDALSPAARLIGAVNTVENKNGIFIGHNTDGIGFMQSIKEENIPMKNQTMTLLGIGGAATAICAQAALDGVDTIHIFSRPNSSHLPRIKTLQDNLEKETSCKIFIHNLFDKQDLKASIKDSCLLVNATSVGMAPHEDECLFEDFSVFHKNLAVADIIYNPWETTLLKKAKATGCKTFNGYPMLLYQGAEAFRIWTGKKMPVELVKEHLKQQ